ETHTGQPADGRPSSAQQPGALQSSDNTDTGRERPVHVDWRFLGLVFVGGTMGTAARETLSLTVPSVDGILLVIVGINLLGAFILGLLLANLARRGEDRGRRRVVRLLLGTGVMGGFTTYSTLAADTALLFEGGRPWVGALYGVGTVVLG